MTDDPFFGKEGDLEAARSSPRAGRRPRLFVYPGDVHLFTDASLPSYDADATRLVLDRSLDLLARL